MQLVRPANVFARLGADVKIGFGEAYMTGDWTTGPGTDLADLLAPFAGRMSLPRAPPAAAAAARGRAHAAGARGEQPAEQPDQHLPALRPVQRAVRAVPGRDDDLLVGLVRARRRPGRRPAPQDGRRPGPRPRRGGHARAGDRLRLGRPGHPRGQRARRPGHHADALHRAAGAGPAAGRRGRRRPPGRRPAAGLPRRDRAVRRDRLRGDDRGGRRGATGRPTSARWTPCSRRAAGSGCRRSRWRTTGCRPRSAATAGSTSTCSPAGSSRRSGRSPTTWPRTPACRSSSAATWARTTRTPSRSGGSSSSATGTRLDGSFDDTFRRMWEFYLAYCEAGFRVGYLGVSQLGLARQPFAGA